MMPFPMYGRWKPKYVKLYTPEDVKKRLKMSIPEFVINAFNDLLFENYDTQRIIVRQDDVIDRILRYSNDDELTREAIFENKWLDIESLYEENGWEVSYEKPILENGKPYFVFKIKI